MSICLKDKAGVILFNFNCQQIPLKVQDNNALVCILSIKTFSIFSVWEYFQLCELINIWCNSEYLWQQNGALEIDSK